MYSDNVLLITGRFNVVGEGILNSGRTQIRSWTKIRNTNGQITYIEQSSIYVIWPNFTVFYYFNFTKYFLNIIGSH